MMVRVRGGVSWRLVNYFYSFTTGEYDGYSIDSKYLELFRMAYLGVSGKLSTDTSIELEW
jgi:hypothetical protein